MSRRTTNFIETYANLGHHRCGVNNTRPVRMQGLTVAGLIAKGELMENSNGMSQGSDGSQPSSLTSSAQSVAQSAPVPQTEERVFKQSEVNEIVKRAKYGAVEDYRKLQSEQPNYVQQKYGEQNSHNQATQAFSNENDIRRLAAEEAQRLRDQWIKDEQSKAESAQAQRTVQNFWNKISPGKEKYPDFDKVVGDISYKSFPNVVQILGDYIDNSDDVLYELGKDRSKMANLETLAYMSPNDAIVQAQRLSQSIKDNQEASKIKTPNEPLRQIRPSNTGTDNGVMSVKDLRSKYKV